MYPTIYLALLSGLRVEHQLPRYASCIFAADLPGAYYSVDSLEDRHATECLAEVNLRLSALADMSLALGSHDEAEQLYRRAQRAVWKDDGLLRLQSCRNAGWLALAHGRPGVAQRSFTRVLAAPEAAPVDRLEAYVGIALALHGQARPQAADDALRAASKLAEEHQLDDRRELLSMLEQELALRLRIRASRSLADHAYWQSALVELRLDAHEKQVLISGRSPSLRLMSMHFDHLSSLERLATGNREAAAGLASRNNHSAALGPAHAFYCRLDSTLAALAGELADVAADIMDRYFNSRSGFEHGNFDYLYCRAKIAANRGDPAAGLKLYAMYANEVMRHLRSEPQPLPLTEATHRSAIPVDDNSMRLPLKYRRAYRYIVENIGREDLNTHEVAAELGVTVRSIQLVFKRCLGMTPCALIRQLRMEGIYKNLMDSSAPTPLIGVTASQWGLRSRSTLAKSYRRHFNESPSESLTGGVE